MFGADGLLTFGPNNQLTNSATLSTQTKTVASNNMILSFYGTGSVTASGVASFTLNGTGAGNQVYHAFTPTAGSLTLTVSGSVTSAVLASVTHETTARSQDQVITGASAYYGPRLDYNPATLAANGLLIEQASTNLALQSNTFSNATWTKDTGLTSVTQNATGIDGTTSAWTVLAAAGTGNHWLYQSQGSSNYTYSVYAKAGTANWIAIADGQGAKTNGVFFNVATGAIGTTNGTRFSNPTITSIGNGFYRCTAQVTVGDNFMSVAINTADNQALNWSAAGTETVIITDTQSEALAFPTSYIPTGAAQVSRAADVATATLPAACTLQGTIQTDSIWPSLAAAKSAPVAEINTAVSPGSVNYTYNVVNGFGNPVSSVVAGSSTILNAASASFISGGVTERISTTYGSAGAYGYWNGAKLGSASGVAPSAALGKIWIGSYHSGGGLNGWLSRLTIWCPPLSQAKAQQNSASW